MMKKKLLVLTVVSLIVCLIGFVAVASACEHGKRKACKSSHGKKEGSLCLYQKEIPGSALDPAILNPGPVCLDDQNRPLPTILLAMAGGS